MACATLLNLVDLAFLAFDTRVNVVESHLTTSPGTIVSLSEKQSYIFSSSRL
jgi:hypothetical protein